jgi:hypothetical protein
MPGNKRGSIYAAHELSGGDDIFYELIGSRRHDAADAPDGIALGEKFSYEIETRGNLLHVSISKDGELRAEQSES